MALRSASRFFSSAAASRSSRHASALARLASCSGSLSSSSKLSSLSSGGAPRLRARSASRASGSGRGGLGPKKRARAGSRPAYRRSARPRACTESGRSSKVAFPYASHNSTSMSPCQSQSSSTIWLILLVRNSGSMACGNWGRIRAVSSTAACSLPSHTSLRGALRGMASCLTCICRSRPFSRATSRAQELSTSQVATSAKLCSTTAVLWPATQVRIISLNSNSSRRRRSVSRRSRSSRSDSW
mmetsp:Transcript_13327/g.31525  ORF Transcript_13327/g.31525 Transcript_13327/m.31525 type:complete len:243 (-) Transcript_13327:273-1001(-)